MSRSHGTGQPAWARCSKCRRNHWRNHDGTNSLGFGLQMQLTGRRRDRFTGRGGARVDPRYQYEYKCLGCGFVGWSRHADLASRWRKEFDIATPAGGSSATRPTRRNR